MFALFFGSDAGHWEYSRFENGSYLPALGLCAVLLPLLWLMVVFTKRAAEHRPWLIVLLWIAAAFPMYLALRALYPISFESIITNDGSDSYYHATQRLAVSDFILRFHEIAPDMPLHIRNNMPGKALLYYLVESLAATPTSLAYWMIFLADVGGILIYLVTQEIFEDRLTSAYALMLYLFIPAKLCFFPLPNTVAPLFILLPFLLWLIYLRKRQMWLLLLVGTSLYGCFIFEPLPFVMGLVFVAFLVRAILQKSLSWREVVGVFIWVPAAFFAVHVAVRTVVGFDSLRWFFFLMDDARDFNVREGRDYWPWLLNNPPDFLFNLGVASAIVFLAEVWRCTRALFGNTKEGATQSDCGTYFTLSVFATLLVLVVWGINRGETQRLWIFLACFIQITVARYLALRPVGLAVNVFTANVIQGAIFLSLVRFVNG